MIMTLPEALEQAKRARNRAESNTKNCLVLYHRKECSACPQYFDCELQATLRQRMLNLEQLKTKTNEQ
jgi:hypothetical protein